ncbi:DnaT-like ssDNA-binding protein [Falsigemmobacter intermedius]|uniref:DnaT-like ssDNA-binding protein n=1 Tax=Falsigemmobacter intermedius TaxID=1553448 RepID=UPI003EFC2361
MTVPAVTPSEATAYVASTGAAGWPSDETAQAQALMRGQRHIASRYNGRWSLDFDDDSVPVEVRYAIIEAATVEARQPGALNPMSTPATDKVLVGAGKLQWERVKGAGGADSYIPRIAAVDGLLRGLVRSGSAHFLARA